jgi:DnaJ like chaperone protein
MSIWGTLLGAVAGLALGGPIGALIGAALGQFAVDQPQQRRRAQDPATRQALFSVAVIALAAKMAASDGNSDPREKAAFDRLFKVTADEQENVSRFWRLAAQTSAGYESYAKQIGKLFKTEPAILEDVAGALCAIALADGHAADVEIDFIMRILDIFAMPAPARARIEARITGEAARDPWAVLGISADASISDIRLRYLDLVKEHHPDALRAKGVPTEFLGVSQARMAQINDAYASLTKSRAA